MNQQTQPQQPTGIVGNTHAAGTRATQTRAVVKAAWAKGPWLHTGIAITVVLLGIVAMVNLPTGPFWKLLFGGAMVWGGGKLAGTKVPVASLWGNIIRGLGWLIIVLTVINSGVRMVAEKSVNWADAKLTEMAGGGSNPTKNAPLIGAGEQVRFDLTGQTMKDEHDVGVFDTLVVTSRRHPRADGRTIYLPCGKIVGPRLVASANGLPATQFKNTSLPGRFENHLVLTEEAKRFLVENQVARVRVTFEAVETTALEVREACHATAW